MRSAAEIAFRLKQEITNLYLLWRPPSAAGDAPSTLSHFGLPEAGHVAEAVKNTAVAAQIEQIAELILHHRFPILGIEITTGPDIKWRRDYLSGIETALLYFRRIPYLDAARTGDHKVIWELNRHQHLVLLAQAWRLTGNKAYLEEVFEQLQSWWAANPFQRGMNWTSTLEVAFRSLSWIWVYHLLGEQMPAGLRSRFTTELYRHGRHIAANLSIYFSPNTHLLGEAVALHAIGRLFPSFPEAISWRRAGARIVAEEMDRQVKEDGTHFEQSSYYHVYAADLFAFHQLLEDTTERYREKLARMALYLDALLGPGRKLPFLGDDDGGRLFHPYGSRHQFGRATLATCAALLGCEELLYDKNDLYEQAVWWIGPEVLSIPARGQYRPQSQMFPDGGTAILAADNRQIIVDAGPFGAGSAGHSHSDTLSIVARQGSDELLIDPGTYTYVGDADWRQWFRATSAHNTIRIDGRDQAVPAGPFRWKELPVVSLHEWTSGPESDRIDASCRYGDVVHRRRVIFHKPLAVIIVDEITGSGKHVIEQFWHLGQPAEIKNEQFIRIGEGVHLGVTPGRPELHEGGEYGWVSEAPGQKQLAQTVRVRIEEELPFTLAAVVSFDSEPRTLGLSSHGRMVELKLSETTLRVVL